MCTPVYTLHRLEAIVRIRDRIHSLSTLCGSAKKLLPPWHRLLFRLAIFECFEPLGQAGELPLSGFERSGLLKHALSLIGDL